VPTSVRRAGERHKHKNVLLHIPSLLLLPRPPNPLRQVFLVQMKAYCVVRRIGQIGAISAGSRRRRRAYIVAELAQGACNEDGQHLWWFLFAQS
jgi:hypothetical protein